jgi:hypothetical protein
MRIIDDFKIPKEATELSIYQDDIMIIVSFKDKDSNILKEDERVLYKRDNEI